MQGIIKNIKALLSPTEEFLQRKMEDHRKFTIAMVILGGVVASVLWIWDNTVDSSGAQDTIILRLLFIPMIIFYSLLLNKIKNRNNLIISGFIIMIIAEANYILILNKLTTGMTYGIGGFMYFFILGLLLFQGYSVRVNILYDIIIAVLPHLLGISGFAINFQHAQYAVLIWPAVFMTAAAQIAFSYNYMLRYNYAMQLEDASNTDHLTGVRNRRYFTPLLAMELLRSKRYNNPVSLLMLDVDNFKNINDTFGHATGDDVICKVADVCRSIMRSNDVIARWGGEEFAVLLPQTDIKCAKVAGERIRKEVENAFIYGPDEKEIHFTVSIGIAQQIEEDKINMMNSENIKDNDLDNDLDLVNRADKALYTAKRQGKNKVCNL